MTAKNVLSLVIGVCVGHGIVVGPIYRNYPAGCFWLLLGISITLFYIYANQKDVK